MPEKINHMKGLLGFATTTLSAVAAWTPEIESMLRIGVSVVGIVAALYTIRFYHHKTKLLLQRKENENER